MKFKNVFHHHTKIRFSAKSICSPFHFADSLSGALPLSSLEALKRNLRSNSATTIGCSSGSIKSSLVKNIKLSWAIYHMI